MRTVAHSWLPWRGSWLVREVHVPNPTFPFNLLLDDLVRIKEYLPDHRPLWQIEASVENDRARLVLSTPLFAISLHFRDYHYALCGRFTGVEVALIPFNWNLCYEEGAYIYRHRFRFTIALERDWKQAKKAATDQKGSL